MALEDDLELAINSNSDVLDKSGNGRDGTVTGMTYDTSTPIIGSGTGVFDGINDYVEIDVASSPQSDILDLTEGQIAVWVRFPDPLNEIKRIFTTSQGIAFPNGDEWHITYRGDSVKELQITVINGGSIVRAVTTPANTINDNDKHLIIVKAPSTGDFVVKVDDIALTLAGANKDAMFFGDAVDADIMTIGALIRDTVSASGTKDIDALAAWSAVKSDAEDTGYWNGGNGVELEVNGAPSNMMMMGVG